MTDEARERFLGEALSAAQLDHDGIVRTYDVGRKGDTDYIVSQYVEGQTLAEVLPGRKLGFREAARLVAEIADALQHAHDRGIVHRDLKPSNIMLARTSDTASKTTATPPEEPAGDSRRADLAGATKSGEIPDLGRPRIMDFGLARRVEAEDSATIA